MPSIYLDPSITNQADWDEIISAALEQITFAVDEWKKSHSGHAPSIGDSVKFELEVKVKNATSNGRIHNEIIISSKTPGLTFVGKGLVVAQPTTTPVASGNGSGGLWGPPATSPVVTKTPAGKAHNKMPTYMPVQIISSAANCHVCGGPGTLMFNFIQCHNKGCKGSK